MGRELSQSKLQSSLEELDAVFAKCVDHVARHGDVTPLAFVLALLSRMPWSLVGESATSSRAQLACRCVDRSGRWEAAGCHRDRLPNVLQSSSALRRAAGAAGFLTLIQSADRPPRYLEPSRFDTMPSQPSLQAR